jgi:hypothetical protein
VLYSRPRTFETREGWLPDNDTRADIGEGLNAVLDEQALQELHGWREKPEMLAHSYRIHTLYAAVKWQPTNVDYRTNRKDTPLVQWTIVRLSESVFQV